MNVKSKSGMLLFRVSYDLASEYSLGSRTFKVRVGAYFRNTSGVYFEQGVRPFVGTVVCEYPHCHEFPPADVVAALSEHEGVPFVGARWSDDFDEIFFDGEPPPTPVAYGEGSLMAPAYHERCQTRKAG